VPSYWQANNRVVIPANAGSAPQQPNGWSSILILLTHRLLVRSNNINSSRHPRESGDPVTLTFIFLNEAKAFRALRE
jgi:hypothetical protein